ncbi:MAG: GWxTD domain-containing protein [Gemmatimonadetes bacterium]|nr:GWxTD domain-containing protein [Gemmatimonadota bacterium]
MHLVLALAVAVQAAAGAPSRPAPAASTDRAPHSAQEPGADTSQLVLYRYWRSPNLTALVGFVRIPLGRLTFSPVANGNTQSATYAVRLTFTDDKGNVLHQERWSRQVVTPKGPIPATAVAVENLAVDLVPGAYRLDMAVADSVTGDSVHLSRQVTTAATKPLVGDLLLAKEIRRLREGESAAPGQLQRGNVLITPDLQRVIPANQPSLALYTEVYPPAGRADTTATVTLVLDGENGFHQERPIGRRRYPAGGGLEMLQLPLGGIRPGPYTLSVRFGYPDTTFSTQQSFTVVPAVEARAVGGLFDGKTEAQIDSLFEVSGYVATKEDVRFYRSLTGDAKRRYLERMWARLDTTPNTPNEVYERYMERVAFANREFKEKTRPGWATERGRIYILHGPPAERYTRPVTGREGYARPFEVWKYSEGRADKYVFYDQSGGGTYQLVYSTDKTEPGVPNWERLFDQETLEFIQSF